MKKLPVIIPLGRGRKPVEIEQSLEIEIYIIHDICESDQKFERIAHTKNRCRDLAKILDSEFVVFNDSDLRHFYSTNFEEMKKFLEENKNFGAVALKRCETAKNHICNGVVMFRKNCLNYIKFDGNIYMPTCFPLRDSLLKNNFGYKYLDEKIRIEEIK